VIRGEGDKSAEPVWTESGEIEVLSKSASGIDTAQKKRRVGPAGDAEEVDEGVDPDNSDNDISCEEYYRNKYQWQDEVVVDNIKSPYETADEW